MDMLTDAQREFLVAVSRTLQIIVGALALGALAFGVVSIVVSSNLQNLGGQQQPLLTYISVAFAFASLVTSWVLPSVMTAKMRQRIAEGQPVATAYAAQHQMKAGDVGDVMPLAGTYQTLLIIRSAILEGAAFFCLITYMIEKQPLSLVAAGILVAFMLSHLPTRSRVEDWVAGELTVIEQLRQMRTADAR